MRLDRTGAVTIIFLLLTAGFVGAISLSPGDSSDTSPDVRFEDATRSSDFRYIATSGAVLTRAGGTYISDVNNDGLPDILVIGGRPRLPPDFDDFARVDPAEPLLMINRNGTFDYIPLPVPERVANDRVTGALFFDYDNDGWDDLLLLPLESRPVLLENNNGTLTLANANFTKKITEPRGATTADYDKDGCLDLFVFQEGNWALRNPVAYSNASQPSTSDNGNRNYLYKGNCEGEFNRVSETGISGSRWSLAATFADLNDDGWPDIHVANDYNNDHIYLNQRNGTFRDVTLGEATDRNAMSSEMADINRDGLPDLFVTNVYFNQTNLNDRMFNQSLDARFGDRLGGNNLLINEGNGTFRDEARQYGVRKGGWGWAGILADFNNDGQLDLFHTTSKLSPSVSGGLNASYVNYPAFFMGTHDRFIPLDAPQIGFNESDGMGTAALDFDRDGGVDIVVGTTAHERFKLYRNDVGGGNWLQVDVEPTETNPAIGTKVYVTIDNTTRMQIYHAQSDFLSQDSRILHFGLGEYERVDSLTIVTPDGTECTFDDLEVNNRITVSGCDLQFDTDT